MRITMGGFSKSIVTDITNNSVFSESLIKWQNLTENQWVLQYSSVFLKDDLIEQKTMSAYIDLNITNIKVPQ